MIESSKHANIIILLPQNENFMYEAWRSNRSEWRHLEFKNILQSFKNVLGHIFEPLTRMYIMYENTITRIDNKKVPASFHFNEMVKACYVVIAFDFLVQVEESLLYISPINTLSLQFKL